jgi:hypothetical protein
MGLAERHILVDRVDSQDADGGDAQWGSVPCGSG